MIINLRGTNGSGKSTVAKGLMKGLEPNNVGLVEYKTPAGRPAHVMGTRVPDLDLIVVGKYTTACGGCDTIKTQDLCKEAVKAASKLASNVFFEGILASTLFSGYLALSQELKKARKGGLVWCYLDTPLEKCLQRIQQRNGGKAINEQLVADKVRAIEATRIKAEAAGETVKVIRHGQALKQILEVLNGTR